MITEAQLATLFEEALDFEANKVVNPSEARKRLSEKMADGVAQFIQGRTVNVIGVQTGVSTTTGTIQ